jgi:hypothetical protein
MELNEAKEILKKNGFILEDTDDWDEADMPAGMSDEDRAEMAKKHNDRRTDLAPETHNQLIAREFKKRNFYDSDWYRKRMYPSGAEQLEDGLWKVYFWYNGGTFEREEYKIEIITDTNYNFLGGEIFYMDSYDYGKVVDRMKLEKLSDIDVMVSKHHYSR